MERQYHGQTTPGKHPAPSSVGRHRSTALARLAPTAPAARLPASAPPMPGHPDGADSSPTPTVSPPTISQAERAHSRLSWNVRLARNARSEIASQLTLKLFGIPENVAVWLGLTTVEKGTKVQRCSC
ncbi:MAG TPA: hypothetical protein VFV38_52785 [Ktedonobacteraceae bacterium]|nr:hypothetical protein [Ktedonobacteraceae bacterium]